MLKLFELLSRHPDMTHQEAMHYWTRRHAAIVRQSAAPDPKTIRYVNNVGLSVGYDGASPFATSPYDGIVAVWAARSFEKLRDIINRPDNIFVPDEPNFLRCRPSMMPVEEIVHKNDARPHASKLMVLFARPHNARRADAVQFWREQHVAREMDYWGDRLVKLTTNVAVPFVWSNWGQESAAFDGCTEYWFDLPPEAMIEKIRDSEPRLIGSQQKCIGPSLRMFIDEVIQIDGSV